MSDLPAARDLEGARFLVADDESFRDVLAILLREAGAEVVTATDGRDAIERLSRERVDAVITDISMPRADGHAVLRHVRATIPEVPVLMMTAVATELGDAVDAIKSGAFDYIQKGGTFDSEAFLRRASNAVELKRSRDENLRLKTRLGDERRPFIVGNSERMEDILRIVERVAPTASAVLVTGESGTGKELIARTLHFNSGRKGRFLTVNCGAFTDELLESELFGHARGAFTGAVTARRGIFEEADRGTLFLDEIGETSPAMQVKLLRVLQEGTFRPVGMTEERSADVRMVAATNRDLEEMVREGYFREDLFYRVHVIPIHLPPLRERREDIPLMVGHFVAAFAAQMGKDVRGVTPRAMELLERHDWPGNVRELRNVIERALALGIGNVLDEEALPAALRAGRAASRGAHHDAAAAALPDGMRLDDFLDDTRKRCIADALRDSAGNQTRAAEMLGITFRAMRYYVHKYGLRAAPPPAEGT